MRYVLVRLLVCATLELVALSAAAQTQRYTIFLDDEAVGRLTVTESAYVGGTTVLNLDSNMKISFLGTFVIESHQASFFRRSLLQEAEAEVRRNDRLREQCQTKRQASGYRITLKGENPRTLTGDITWTVGQLYLHEPKGVRQVYSERLGQMCAVRALSGGVYEVEQPNGSLNRYTYQQGICQRMETTSNLKDVRFERQR